jgi:hypothetical protein
MVSLYLKNKLNVCLVAFANSFGHYNNIGNKLGNNLNNARDNGSLVFVDTMKILLEALSENEIPINHPGALFDTSASGSDSGEAELRNLFMTIKEQLDAFSDPSKSTLVVIDDTSILLNLGLRPQVVMTFVSYLRRISVQSGHCLLVVQRCDDDTDDEDGLLLKRQTSHLSDLLINVRGLQSGYSKDVHGEVMNP